MKINTDPQKIKELLGRGVEEVIVHDSLIKKLNSGKQLRVKFGIDPTGSELHIGHAVPLRKLRQFQEMGHQIILLIGDYTATIGDPTGRNETRPMMTREQIEQNMRTYIEQASKIIDVDKTEVRYNSEWYKDKKLDFIMELTGKITVARVLDRDDFQTRLKEGSDIQMQEILYPLLQGYDSVALKADIEIGATDQKFNMLMGRKLQKRYDQSEQEVLTLPLLVGTDGEKKMSKTYGNYISLLDTPEDMYGKTMSIPDELIINYFELATDLSLEEIKKYEEKLASSIVNPRDIKAKLAFLITELFYDQESAKQGQEHFSAVIQSKDKPEEIPEISPSKNDIITVLVEAKIVSTTSDARRAIKQGGVKIDDKKVEDIEAEVKAGQVVQKGKRFFVKVK